MLKKEFCKQCWERRHDEQHVAQLAQTWVWKEGWTEGDDLEWEKGKVICAFSDALNNMHGIKKEPLEDCPFWLEHTLNAD